ncbi:PCI domain-containing protein [Aphelenchoides avenae]|nr:PCI domain-containing protein [Aphelenchus avenae]
MVEFCKKALADPLEKASSADLDRIFNALTPDRYVAGVVCALIAKLNKVKSNDDLSRFLAQVADNVPRFNQEQLEWTPELYCALFLQLSEVLIKKNRALSGISLLASAIEKLQGDVSGRLTSVHAALFCLCLKAKRFDAALPYFSVNINHMFSGKSSGYVETRHVLLYFYYGGMILCALERFDQAQLFFEYAVCVPSLGASAIVIESYKKYVLASILANRSATDLPSYRSPVVRRCITNLCQPYSRLAVLQRGALQKHENIGKAVEELLEKKQQAFAKDHNVGLVRQIINACATNAVKRLPETFISVQLPDTARRCAIADQNDAERILRSLIYKGDIVGKIDRRTQSVRFDIPPTEVKESVVDANMQELMELAALVRAVDDQARLNPNYVTKSKGGSSAGMFPEDEGFHTPTLMSSLFS